MRKLLKLVFFSVIIFIILNVFYLHYSFSFLIEEEKYLIYFVILISLIGLISSLLLKKNNLLKYFFLILIVAIITFFSGEFIKAQQLERARNNADVLIELLLNYKKENGYYPSEIYESTLHLGTPNYRIGLISRKFEYENKGEYYLLTYDSFKYKETYNSKKDNWHLDD
jgi:ABC-type multidrug transport system permease subunit